MQTTFTIGIGILATIFLLLHRYFAVQHDEREPPIARSSIPLIGHIIGMSKYSSYYYVRLRDIHKAPMLTLQLPGTKMYIVNAPQLIAAVQRQVQTLSFNTIAAKFSQKICGSSKEANDIVNFDILGKENSTSYLLSFFKAIHPPLMPGPDLDAMNRVMVSRVASSVDDLAASTPITIDLYKWLRHELTLATTESNYGPSNPFRDDKIADAFWKFEQNVMWFFIDVIPPRYTVPSAFRARKVVSDAFEVYFRNKAHESGSSLVQARYQHSREHNITVEDIARFEVGGSLATLTNTFPSTYWMLCFVFSDPAVLKDCRNEIARIISQDVGPDGSNVYTIDLSDMKVNCPILTSTWQEVLRVCGSGLPVREVLEDCEVEGYLLKKGSTLIMPTNVIHASKEIWGDDVAEFNHKRFLKDVGNKRVNPAAFRTFGGGNTLCPGRHFATTEVLAVTTMMLIRFDLQPTEGSWPRPKSEEVRQCDQIIKPSEDLKIRVSLRKEFKAGDRWAFVLTDSSNPVSLTVEDS
ncbi:cytochrome P450 [Patellaria atrata CBS 101060]|uniref:Cytochrome P450 n=1 Tax=Patellaria atrata CBS 101060 TaxID=1346257 RepID=A0A9P4S8A9_9PEZI|nr:cytochrome P450 [Patellaria atrata CBS 101060]